MQAVPHVTFDLGVPCNAEWCLHEEERLLMSLWSCVQVRVCRCDSSCCVHIARSTIQH